MPVQSLNSVAERPHWKISGEQATFAPVHGGWRAVMSSLQSPTADARYHVAVIDRAGEIRYTMRTADLGDAVRSAEHAILARNALRPVPHR